ncbi:hypothetical protein [Burkholderia vietnamiensis]|uniref:hypothetical protein n=1 Tax=Burkholderia vietnamiensis TaxID=60552 RepID=UPI001CF44A2F|nr:hypothetical protein [Burkholderia vietnamiensis]MCA8448902.1 hypothetical protein [Burkholderia vietnamiensis]
MTTQHIPTAERSIDPTGSLVNVLPIAHRAGALLGSTDPVYVTFDAFTVCCDRANARNPKKGDALWRDLARLQVQIPA